MDRQTPDSAAPPRPDRVMAAAGLMLLAALVIGYTDNQVQVIAAEAGLWQFHATRSALALGILALVAAAAGLRLRPQNWRAVLGRSMLHASAMLVYFGALAFLPVAVAAAALFTAPIFVLLIGRVFLAQPAGLAQVLAVLIGFAGVVMVLGPQALAGASVAAVLPIAAAILYGLGNIATRQWCAGESAATLLAGFFAALGLCGAVGMGVLALLPQEVPPGTDGFILRGPVVPSAAFWLWTSVQAAGSLFGVGLMIRAYQMTQVGRASVLEYLILPASAIWAWVLFDQQLGMVSIFGMGLIAIAGALIALRQRA